MKQDKEKSLLLTSLMNADELKWSWALSGLSFFFSHFHFNYSIFVQPTLKAPNKEWKKKNEKHFIIAVLNIPRYFDGFRDETEPSPFPLERKLPREYDESRQARVGGFRISAKYANKSKK